jgi:cyclophilin family peptidyl-prolyl cis-trans isomerase
LASPAPADLRLSSLTINESDRIGVPIGTLNALGANGALLPSTGLTYALVAGAGSTDNNRFRLVNGQLQAAEVFDRENRAQLQVRIRVSDASGRSTEKAFTITVNDLPNPLATTPPSSPALVLDATSSVVDLNTRFDDPLSTGLVATFQLAPVQLPNDPAGTLGSGQIRVLLYNQTGQGAPLTTSNLQAYLTANRYNNTFIHRSVPGFVVQGGGFNVEQSASGNQILEVTTFPAVKNEFSADRANLRGTIAMAKLGNDPNSATSQWFWSLADNRAILDPQNGGFTVFGRVLDSTDLATLDAMAAVPVFNASAALGDVFKELPLSNGELSVDNLLRFSAITIDQRAELSYALIANSDPDLLGATLNGSRLQLRPLANRTKEVSLTLRATNLLGETLDQILRVQLRRQTSNTATIHTFDDSPGNPTPNLARPTLTGTLASALQADERVSILADGTPIGLATPSPDGLSWRFQPTEAFNPGADGVLDLQARVETLAGATGALSVAWGLQLGTEAKLKAPGRALLRLADSRPLVVQPGSSGTWDAGFEAWNAGSTTAAGQAVAGTGEAIGIGGLRRYAVSLRDAATSQVTLELGDGNHAFFLHDSWSPQVADLPTQTDWQGRATAPRWDQLATIRLGNCDAAGATSLVDLTSPDFITGPLTVVGGNTRGSRNVIWGSAADDTVIGGAADTVICASAGRNTLKLGTGADRLQYVSGAGAIDRVTGFNPARDRLELWGVTPGTFPTLSLQAEGRNTLLTWNTNRVTFSGTSLPLPAPGTLPDWVVVM